MGYRDTFNYMILIAFEKFSMANDPHLFLEIENLMYENDMDLFGENDAFRLSLDEVKQAIAPGINTRIKQEMSDSEKSRVARERRQAEKLSAIK